jgi:hypothetical protein
VRYVRDAEFCPVKRKAPASPTICVRGESGSSPYPLSSSAGTTTTARAIKPAAEEEVVAPEVADAEFVSLEEADAEAQGKMTADGDVIGGAEEAEEEAEEEVELEDAGLNDAAFIEEQEEGDEDVTDIIGDVDDKEET